MKLFSIALLAAATLLSTPALAVDRTVILAVKNMTCATCAPTVKKSLTQIKGVKRVAVSTKTHTAKVIYDDKVTKVSALVNATTNAGYPSRPKR